MNFIKCIFYTLAAGLILFYGCSKKSTKPDDEIELDGRGGGILSYCYQPLSNGLHQIYAMNADGSGSRKLVESSIGLNHQDWSPDGQKLAAVGYVTQSTWSIYVFNSDGSNLTRLTPFKRTVSRGNSTPVQKNCVFLHIFKIFDTMFV